MRTDIPLDGAPGHQWDGLIVLCAANYYHLVKLADQHLAERLAEQRPVLYVDPPLSQLAARRNPALASCLEGPRLRLLAPNLARLTPVVQPFNTRTGMSTLATTLSRRILRRATASLGGDVAAVISAWPLHPVLGSCNEEVGVYWAQDDFVGGAQMLGLNPARLAAGERRSARSADLIIAANPVVADTWRGRGYDPALIPYGADVAAYASVDDTARPADVTLPGPIAGFVGHINDRIDLGLLESIASRDRSLLLVGPRNASFEPARWAALIDRPNVQWVGAKAFDDLPGYFGVIDVGLVPYGDSPFNRGSFPLKTMEYLAAGRPVVSTDLPATRWFDTDLVSVADSPDQFADAVDQWARRPRSVREMARRRSFAAGHDWTVRANAVVAAIDDVALAGTGRASEASNAPGVLR